MLSFRSSFSLHRALLSAAVAACVAACGDGGSNVEVPPLQITTVTGGSDLDPDGYAASVDDAAPISIGINDTATVGDVTAGEHVVRLSGVAPNCRLQDGDSRTVMVAAGGTVSADFSVECDAAPAGEGAILVTTATTGSSADPDGYAILLDDRSVGPIPSGGSATVGGVSPGSHTIGLGDVAAGCQVTGDNPQTIPVVADSTSSATFAIACAPSTGGAIAKWTQVQRFTAAKLFDVWGSGPGDFWAAGTDLTHASAGVIDHYDGSEWSEQFRSADIQLDAVWGTGSGNVYAVGAHNGSAAAAILHYDGSNWSEIAGPAVTAPGDTLILWQSVWGLSDHDIYVVGAGYGPTINGFAAHFDGQQWSLLSLPTTANREPLDVWGTSPQDLYIAGVLHDPTDTTTAHDHGIVLHYNGTAWTETVLGEDGVHLKAVWGTAPDNVYVVGDPGIIVHWDGATWTEAPRLITSALHEVWGTSPGNVYAVAARGPILRFDGTQWSEMEFPIARDLFGIWGSAPDDAWSVGVNGVILHGTP